MFASWRYSKSQRQLDDTHVSISVYCIHIGVGVGLQYQEHTRRLCHHIAIHVGLKVLAQTC